jgi:predicted PhzF superfamily epimerase YddE/YHI9
VDAGETHPAAIVVDVFAGEDGGGGNRLGVFVEPPFGAERFQLVATELGYSETVFVTDARRGALRIHTPAVELPLAGHPLVGAAHVLAGDPRFEGVLRPPAGEVSTFREDGRTWIRARPEWVPHFDRLQRSTPADVDAHRAVDVPADACLQVWAWIDEAAGIVRARVFPRAHGIDEDEATGGAAILLCDALGRELVIRQGAGSEIRARPLDGLVAIGGRVRDVAA